MTQQVEYYSTVYKEVVQQPGAFEAQKNVSKSLFLIMIGSNDLLKYFDQFHLGKKSTPQEFVDLLMLTLKQQLKVTKSFQFQTSTRSNYNYLICTSSF